MCFVPVTLKVDTTCAYGSASPSVRPCITSGYPRQQAPVLPLAPAWAARDPLRNAHLVLHGGAVFVLPKPVVSDQSYLNHIKGPSPRPLPGVPVRSGDATFPKAMDNVTVRQGESATLRPALFVTKDVPILFLFFVVSFVCSQKASAFFALLCPGHKNSLSESVLGIGSV
ncbi:hypothetical protein MJT46_016446 [Ovis ammon polii x Ovis aries]|nr:hypothetical protein MJT46_016446 [Ovis ammon polii x Ovis aries]